MRVQSEDGKFRGEVVALEATPRYNGRDDQRNCPMPRKGDGVYVAVTNQWGFFVDYAEPTPEGLAPYGLYGPLEKEISK